MLPDRRAFSSTYICGQGRIAKAIVECVQKHGGCMTEEDLASHTSTHDDPIHVNYRGVDVWEIPPNGQGAHQLGGGGV